MGTIVERTRKDGSKSYTAQIRLKRLNRIVHSEAQTFDRKPAAAAWLRKRERELEQDPDSLGLKKTSGATLDDAIDRYIKASIKEIGRTKEQVLRSIRTYDIATLPCSAIRSETIVAFAQELGEGGRKPQTVANYLSHLAAVFDIARPAWGFELDQQAMKDAHKVLRQLGTVSKSDKRSRRPTLAELDKLMSYFSDRSARSPRSAPMPQIIAFAIFSTRRLEEITRITWSDFEPAHMRVLVRDMKHPGQKIGNHVFVDLPVQAVKIIEAMPRTADQIFPFTGDAIGAAFTRACQFLGIEDLHFHDLRHDGVSRLFEMGNTIPHVAAVSGHRSWQSLQRYTHLRQTGDKYNGWHWLDAVTSAD